jgi:hypothetical protein
MPRTYEILGTLTASGSTQLLTFSSIPQGYTDLRLVANVTVSSGASGLALRFNGSGSGYSQENFKTSTGNNPSAGKIGNELYFDLSETTTSGSASPSIITCDILQYASTVMKKSTLHDRGYQSGVATTSSSQRFMCCGLWENTAAITSVSVIVVGNNIAAGGTATLFGILKA